MGSDIQFFSTPRHYQPTEVTSKSVQATDRRGSGDSLPSNPGLLHEQHTESQVPAKRREPAGLVEHSAAKRHRYSGISIDTHDMDQRESEFSKAFKQLESLDGSESQKALTDIAKNVSRAKPESVSAWTSRTLHSIRRLPQSHQLRPIIALLANFKSTPNRDEITENLTMAFHLIDKLPNSHSASALAAYVPHISKCSNTNARILFEHSLQKAKNLADSGIDERSDILSQLALNTYIFPEENRSSKLNLLRREIASLPVSKRSTPLQSAISMIGALPHNLRADELSKSLDLVEGLPKSLKAEPLDEAASVVWLLPSQEQDELRYRISGIAQTLTKRRQDEILTSVGLN